MKIIEEFIEGFFKKDYWADLLWIIFIWGGIIFYLVFFVF